MLRQTRAHGGQRGTHGDKVWSAAKADSRQSLEARGHKGDTRWAEGRHVADKVWRGGAGTWHIQCGHMAGTRWTHGGHIADKVRGLGHIISRPAFYFLRDNPRVNGLGNYTSIDPKQFFKHRVRLQRPNLGPKMNADEAGMQFAECKERILYFMMPRPVPQQATRGQSPGEGTWWA